MILWPHAFRPKQASTSNQSNNYLIVFVLSGSILAICFVILEVFYCKRHGEISIEMIKIPRKWRNDEHGLVMKNGVVISIGIGDYQTRSRNVDFAELLVNIPVESDVNNMKQLADFLNFPFLPIESKVHWTEQEIFEFLDKIVAEQFFDDYGNIECECG